MVIGWGSHSFQRPPRGQGLQVETIHKHFDDHHIYGFRVGILLIKQTGPRAMTLPLQGGPGNKTEYWK
jgi:hypothetical protein